MSGSGMLRCNGMTVTCSCCWRLDTAAIAEVPRTLKKLTINNCPNVSAVQLVGRLSQLQHISVSHNASMADLNFSDCPDLVSLSVSNLTKP